MFNTKAFWTSQENTPPSLQRASARQLNSAFGTSTFYCISVYCISVYRISNLWDGKSFHGKSIRNLNVFVSVGRRSSFASIVCLVAHWIEFELRVKTFIQWRRSFSEAVHSLLRRLTCTRLVTITYAAFHYYDIGNPYIKDMFFRHQESCLNYCCLKL